MWASSCAMVYRCLLGWWFELTPMMGTFSFRNAIPESSSSNGAYWTMIPRDFAILSTGTGGVLTPKRSRSSDAQALALAKSAILSTYGRAAHELFGLRLQIFSHVMSREFHRLIG